MRLLLLLSALLAALSGASADARAPSPRLVEVAARLATAAPAPAHANVLLASRPVATPTVEAALVLRAVADVPAPRLWTSRRRE
jgi:hypothetical protein